VRFSAELRRLRTLTRRVRSSALCLACRTLNCAQDKRDAPPGTPVGCCSTLYPPDLPLDRPEAQLRLDLGYEWFVFSFGRD
jgi:hypothetical protein